MGNSKKILIFLSILALLFTLIECIFVYFAYSDNIEKIEIERMKSEKNKIAYNECLVQAVDSDDLTESILNLEKDIDNYFQKKYYTSVGYYDILTGFSYNYHNNIVYYGASLIKIVDALYLINEAIDGNIDLDEEKIMYTSKYIADYSKGMKKRNLEKW